MAEVLGAVSIVSTVLSITIDTVRAIDVLRTPKNQNLERVRSKLVKISQSLLQLQRYSLNVPFQERIIMTTHLDSVMAALFKTVETLNHSLSRQKRDESERRMWTRLRWVHSDWQDTIDVLERHEEVLKIWIARSSLADTPVFTGSTPSVSMTRISDRTPQGLVEDQRLKILQWLSPIDHRERHLKIQKQRLDGTGRWFLESEEFKYWKTSLKPSLLWLNGRAGTGKTFLTSTIIDHLSEATGRERCAVAYFYCDFRQPRTFVDIAASITRQIVSLNAQLPPLIRDLFGRPDREEHPSLADLIRIYFDGASIFDKVYVVLDAFDELQRNKDETYTGISHVLQHSETRVLVLSRSEAPEKFQNSFSHITPLVLSPNVDDLYSVLSQSLASTPFNNMDENLKDDVVTSLTTRADGLFLLPVLQIDNIVSRAVTRKDIRDALTKLPLTLDVILDNKIAEIKRQEPRLCQYAADTLMWLSYAKRPLLIQELCEILALSSTAHLNQDDIPAPLFIERSCMGLITIDPSSTVSLSHSSVVVYLRGEHNKLFSNGMVRACLSCLEYLELKNFAERDLIPEQQTKALMQHPFLDYASSSWMYHVQDVRHDESTLAQTLADQLSRRKTTPPDPILEDPKSLRSMLSRISALTQRLIKRSSESSWPLLFHFNFATMQPHREGAHHEMTAPRRMTTGLSPLHICARFGFFTEAMEFITEHQNAPLSGSWTALHEAARCNNLKIAKLLIETGHERNLKDEDDRTPLHYASYHGFQDMVLLLLQHSHLDVKEKTSKKTPLHFAAKMGHEKVVRILLDDGAGIGVRDAHGRTALHYAAENGHTDVARLLLEKGADPMASDEKGQTALHCAVLSRSEDLVRIVLMQDQSSIFQTDFLGRTPLHLAAERAFSVVVDMLLAEGANANAVDNNDKTPLIYAVQSGHVDVVERLLRRFADPNFSPGPDFVTHVPSPQLSPYGQPSWDILQAKSDSSGETALLLAVREGNKEMVNSLLMTGADPNWTNSRGETALFIAVSNNMAEIVDILVRAGAQVNAKTLSGSTPLEIAAEHRNTELMKILVDSGAAWDFNTSSEPTSKSSTTLGVVLQKAIERSQSSP